jgi:hypothetical protein
MPGGVDGDGRRVGAAAAFLASHSTAAAAVAAAPAGPDADAAADEQVEVLQALLRIGIAACFQQLLAGIQALKAVSVDGEYSAAGADSLATAASVAIAALRVPLVRPDVAAAAAAVVGRGVGHQRI